jgi:hypothetical protein
MDPLDLLMVMSQHGLGDYFVVAHLVLLRRPDPFHSGRAGVSLVYRVPWDGLVSHVDFGDNI